LTPYNIQEQILALKGQGLSSRKIAKELGVGKSTVNDIYNKLKGSIPESAVKKPKILLLDIETACSITATFGRRLQNISQDAVLKEGGWIISYAYKWLGDDNVQGSVLHSEEARDSNDERLCMELLDLLEQSDYVVAHNGSNFDIPIIKARLIINGLPPMRKVRIIDSLNLSREFRFNSQKLDSLCRQLDIGEKVKHLGISMWIDCQNGDKQALSEMYFYNEKDVVLLEELYMIIRSYSTRHPNLAVNLGDKPRCNICCSDNVKPTGNLVSTNLSVFEEYTCGDCQARFKTRQSTTTREQRKNFLSN
jgi:transposase